MNEEELLAILQGTGLPPEQARAMLAMLLSGDTGFSDPVLGANVQALGPGDDLMDAVGDSNKQIDYVRDLNSMLADPYTMAASGLSSIPGLQNWQVDQFQPEREYVDAPARQSFDRALGEGMTTPEGWVAAQIDDGKSSAWIEGTLGSIFNGPNGYENLTPDEQAIFDIFAGSVTPRTDDFSGETYYDVGPYADTAKAFEEQQYVVADPNSKQDEAGRWYIESPSEQMETFDERGLPYPTLQYELADFTPEGAAADERVAMLRELMSRRESGDTQPPLGYEGDPAWADLRSYADLDQDVTNAYNRFISLPTQATDPGTAIAGTRGPDAMGGGEAPATSPYPSLPERPMVQGEAIREGPRGRVTGHGEERPMTDEEYAQYLYNEGRPPTSRLRGPNRSSGGPGPEEWLAAIQSGTGFDALMGGTNQPSGTNQPGGPGASASARHRGRVGDEVSVTGFDQPSGPGASASARHRGRVANQGTLRQLRTDADKERARLALKAALGQQAAGSQMSDRIALRRAEEQAQGRRFWGQQDDGSWGFAPDQGIAQGKVNYAQAMAQGRTPLGDELDRRKRAAMNYLFGG